MRALTSLLEDIYICRTNKTQVDAETGHTCQERRSVTWRLRTKEGGDLGVSNRRKSARKVKNTTVPAYTRQGRI